MNTNTSNALNIKPNTEKTIEAFNHCVFFIAEMIKKYGPEVLSETNTEEEAEASSFLCFIFLFYL